MTDETLAELASQLNDLYACYRAIPFDTFVFCESDYDGAQTVGLVFDHKGVVTLCKNYHDTFFLDFRVDAEATDRYLRAFERVLSTIQESLSVDRL